MSNSNDDLARAFYLTNLPFGVGNGTLDPTPGGGVITQPPGSDSLNTYGATTAPGAGVTLAALTTPPYGLYEVRVMIRISTAANPSLTDNIEILQTAAVKRTVVHGVVGTTSTVHLPEYIQQFRVDGTQNILVRTKALEAAGVTYAVSLYARRIAD